MSTVDLETLASLCKRRGFIFQSSDIYGGLNGFWDYGPLGVLLKNNIRDWWWRQMVECPPLGPDGHPLQMVGLDSAIIQHPTTWVASGHVGGFSDPMSTCRQCKKLLRADHVGEMLKESAWVQSFAESMEVSGWGEPFKFNSLRTLQWSQQKGKRLAPGLALVRNPQTTMLWLAEDLQQNPALRLDLRLLLQYLATEQKTAAGLQTPCPHCGGDLTEPRDFNLMFESYTGAVRDEDNKVYLRPETAQGIFLNYRNVVNSTRVKVPFGVAQIGKSFRNEVTPRNFIFRSREFEQMEMEWFCHPDEALSWYEFWRAERMRWWRSLGVCADHLRFRDHDADELSHYSQRTVDIEYRYPFTAPDYGELEGIAHRGCFDLQQHQEHSGQKLEYFDQEVQMRLRAEGASAEESNAKSRYLPHVIEPASGLTRAVLVVLCEAYRREKDRQGTEEYLSILPQLAPIKLGVFPLVNKDGMPEVAEKLYLDLRQRWTCEYDPKQSIGKRYARMDEVGTPFCLTVDSDTLRDQTVTVRERDSMQQVRVAAEQVTAYLQARL